MGGLVSAFRKLFSSFNTEQRILMLGLDAAGKTTVLYNLKLGERVNTIPTIGFNVETLQYKKLTMNIWDVGGQHRIRPLWRHYFQGVDALIFVVDASDRERMQEAQQELAYLLEQDELRHAMVLVLANKMDLPNAMEPKDIAKAMNLNNQRARKWFVQPAVATTGDGLFEGLDWLCQSMKEAKKEQT